MEVEAQDLIDAYIHQRDGALKAHAETAAMLEAVKRKLAALEKQIEELKNNQQ